MDSAPEQNESKHRERSIYLAMKIKALKDEILRLRAEEAETRAKIRSAEDKKTPEMKALKSRLIYLRGRPDEAREEMDAASTERKKLIEILRPAAS